MGRVVPFERPMPPAPKPSGQQSGTLGGIPLRTTTEPGIRSMISTIIGNLEQRGIEDVPIRTMKIRIYLDSLHGYVSPRNIAERKRGLAPFTDDELRTLLYEGDEPQWKEKPAYYRALLEIVRERNIRGTREQEPKTER